MMTKTMITTILKSKKNKIRWYQMTERDLYKLDSSVSNPNSEYYIPFKEYRGIQEIILKSIADMLMDGVPIKPSRKFGELVLNKKLSRGKSPIDWNKTRKLWKDNPQAKAENKRIYLNNEHTEGFIVFLNWRKLKGTSDSNLWRFNVCRTFVRRLSKKLKNDSLLLNIIDEC